MIIIQLTSVINSSIFRIIGAVCLKFGGLLTILLYCDIFLYARVIVWRMGKLNGIKGFLGTKC